MQAYRYLFAGSFYLMILRVILFILFMISNYFVYLMVALAFIICSIVSWQGSMGYPVCELVHFFFHYWFILFAGWRFIPDLHDRLCGDVPVPGWDPATHCRGHCDRYRSTSGEYQPNWSTKWHQSSVYYYIVVVSVVVQTSPLPAFLF